MDTKRTQKLILKNIFNLRTTLIFKYFESIIVEKKKLPVLDYKQDY